MKILRKIFLITLVIQFAITIITIFVTILWISEISSKSMPETVARYYTVVPWEGAALILKDDNSFYYSRGTCSPSPEVKGVWTKSNDTIELNAEKSCIYHEDGNDKTRIENDCIFFKNAKFKIFSDSISFVSGEPDIGVMKLFKLK